MRSIGFGGAWRRFSGILPLHPWSAIGKCSCEHMPDACPSLQKANESRRRAWAELQKIRSLLALVAEDLPPPAKPASFEAEGAALRAAMAKAFLDLLNELDALDGAIAGMRPFFANPTGTSAYANALITLNRATNRPRPSGKAIQELRGFCRGGNGGKLPSSP